MIKQFLTHFFLDRFKNGQPYPWSSEMSPLILYPEAENQTIYTRAASYNDNGNYTCVLRNDTHKTEHNIQLFVQGEFIITYIFHIKSHFHTSFILRIAYQPIIDL